MVFSLWTIIDGFPQDRRAGGEKLLEKDQNLKMSQLFFEHHTSNEMCLKVGNITVKKTVAHFSLIHMIQFLYTFKWSLNPKKSI